jgi:uncharacterized protein YaiI (UPF0178 family)
MRIIIDGDSCPVIEETKEIAQNNNIKLIVFCDYNHNINSSYGEVKKVDQSFQSVDMEIVNFTQENDIVITDDYGLASLVLSKKCLVINSKGIIYNNNNIDNLLMRRHINKKIRRAGGKHPSPSKRTKEDNKVFKKNLLKLIKNNLKNN